jgi:hypothetical protein
MTDALKSASITALDVAGSTGAPIVEATAGIGAPYHPKKLSDFVTVTAAGIAASGSTYKMVRLPSTVYLKHVNFYADSALDTGGGSAALTIDVGTFYSDSTTDGTNPANTGAIGDNQIADAYSILGGTMYQAIEAGKWTEAKRQQPLWQAAGLSVDPGGYIDIVVTVETGANTGAAVAFALEVEFSH